MNGRRIGRSRNGPVAEQRQEPLGTKHARLDALPEEVDVQDRKELLEESVELEHAQLEGRHFRKEVATEVVGIHESDENAKGFLVGHLRGASAGCGIRAGRRTLSNRTATTKGRPWQ